MKNISTRNGILLIVFGGILAYFFITHFLYTVVTVSGSSMEPHYHSGEKLLVSRIALLWHPLQRGDVIVFHEYSDYRGDGGQDIKRVDGLEGDTRISGSNYITLKHSQYFVRGDNVEVSYDSRFYGPITSKQLVGLVIQ